MLYNQLWRTNEIKKIKESKTLNEKDKNNALKAVLNKETDLL